MGNIRLPVEAIEGIGPVRATRLASAGIHTVAEFIAANSVALRTLGLNPDNLAKLQAAAQILRIDSATPDVAEALAEAGIGELAELADSGLQTLERAVGRAHTAGRLSDPPSLYRLAQTQREACRFDDRGGICGTVRSHDDAAPTSGTVRIGRRSSDIDDEGRFAIDGLTPGVHRMTINRPVASFPIELSATIAANRIVGPIAIKVPTPEQTAQASAVSTSESTGLMITPTFTIRWRLIWASLDELAIGQELVVRSKGDPARLLDINRTRVGNYVLITRYRVDRHLLPEGAASGDVVQWNGSELIADDTGIDDLRHQRFLRTIELQRETSTRRTVIGGVQ